MSAQIPPKMQAVTITEFGAPEVMQVNLVPTPVPGVGEVLVQNCAAGINRPDVMQRQGIYPPPPGATDIPGLEIAGRVVALGEGVESLSIGDSVCALVVGGGYAEYCVAAAELCLPIPNGMEISHAAALPETFFTVWANVFERGQLQAGETLLVHGGSSGIGTVAIQLGKAFGAKVLVTAGSNEKCAACVKLGADAAINYQSENFVERSQRLTNNQGVDLILDMVAGDYLSRNLECLAMDGRLVQIAFQKGPKTEIDFLPVLLKRLTITGSVLRARSVEEKAKIARALQQKIWPLLAEGRVKPVIHATFPLSQVVESHRMMEASQHIGKILLSFD